VGAEHFKTKSPILWTQLYHYNSTTQQAQDHKSSLVNMIKDKN